MSISLGFTAVAATMLMAAMSGVYGGDYPAITQADWSPRSAQRLSQTVEPSTPAVQLGQESPPSGGTCARTAIFRQTCCVRTTTHSNFPTGRVCY